MKVYNVMHIDWVERIHVLLWAYCTTCKRLAQHTLLKLVYGKEVVMPMEFLVSRLRIALQTGMTEDITLHDHLDELMYHEENKCLTGFHHRV